jgi:predicted RNA-binding Zn ribbon-like protein
MCHRVRPRGGEGDEHGEPQHAAHLGESVQEPRDLYALFRAVAEGDDLPAESIEALCWFECEALSHADLVSNGSDGFAWKWALGDDLGGLLWPVAHSATELLTSRRLGRVKSCAGCNWLFVDESKNRSRRWCAMEDCGTHAKMRRYVARRAAKRKS